MCCSAILKTERVIEMKKTILQLETVTCPSCIKRIEGSLKKLSGVDHVEVKFNASKVEVRHDENEITIDALSHMITKLGYKVLSVI